MIGILTGVPVGVGLFFILMKLVNGITAKGKINIPALLLFMFTPLVYLFLIALISPPDILTGGVTLSGVIIILSVVNVIVKSKKNKS